MWLHTKVSTCEHQISHDFSIKLVQGEFEEQAHKRRTRKKSKSLAPVKKGQERRKQDKKTQQAKERQKMDLPTVQLDLQPYNYPYSLGAYPGLSTILLEPSFEPPLG